MGTEATVGGFPPDGNPSSKVQKKQKQMSIAARKRPICKCSRPIRIYQINDNEALRMCDNLQCTEFLGAPLSSTLVERTSSQLLQKRRTSCSVSSRSSLSANSLSSAIPLPPAARPDFTRSWVVQHSAGKNPALSESTELSRSSSLQRQSSNPRTSGTGVVSGLLEALPFPPTPLPPPHTPLPPHGDVPVAGATGGEASKTATATAAGPALADSEPCLADPAAVAAASVVNGTRSGRSSSVLNGFSSSAGSLSDLAKAESVKRPPSAAGSRTVKGESARKVGDPMCVGSVLTTSDLADASFPASGTAPGSAASVLKELGPPRHASSVSALGGCSSGSLVNSAGTLDSRPPSSNSEPRSVSLVDSRPPSSSLEPRSVSLASSSSVPSSLGFGLNRVQAASVNGLQPPGLGGTASAWQLANCRSLVNGVGTVPSAAANSKFAGSKRSVQETALGPPTTPREDSNSAAFPGVLKLTPLTTLPLDLSPTPLATVPQFCHHPQNRQSKAADRKSSVRTSSLSTAESRPPVPVPVARGNPLLPGWTPVGRSRAHSVQPLLEQTLAATSLETLPGTAGRARYKRTVSDSSGAPLNGTSRTLNPSAASLNGTSRILNPSAAPLNGTSRTLNPSAAPLNGTSRTLNSSAAPLNRTSRTLNPSVAPLNGTSRTLNPSVAPLNGTSRALKSSAAPLNGTSRTLNPSVAPLNGTSRTFNPSAAPLNGTSRTFSSSLLSRLLGSADTSGRGSCQKEDSLLFRCAWQKKTAKDFAGYPLKGVSQLGADGTSSATVGAWRGQPSSLASSSGSSSSSTTAASATTSTTTSGSSAGARGRKRRGASRSQSRSGKRARQRGTAGQSQPPTAALEKTSLSTPAASPSSQSQAASIPGGAPSDPEDLSSILQSACTPQFDFDVDEFLRETVAVR